MMAATARPQIIHDLRERIQGIEASRQRLGGESVSTGFEPLDRLLNPRLKPGSLIEWVGANEGSGVAALALTVAANLLRQNGALVVIDDTADFYPVAAAELGIPLDRTIVIRPETRIGAMWAWEQALRCPGVAVTFGRIDTIDDRLLRRLQLAVETGGGLGFLLRPPDSRSGPSWASTRISVQPREAATRRSSEAEPFYSLTRRLQVSLVHGELIEVELEDEASDVRLVSELADSTTTGRRVG